MEHEEQGYEDKRHQEHDGDQEGSEAEDMAVEIRKLTGLRVVSAPNKFESLAAHDAQTALS